MASPDNGGRSGNEKEFSCVRVSMGIGKEDAVPVVTVLASLLGSDEGLDDAYRAVDEDDGDDIWRNDPYAHAERNKVKRAFIRWVI